jgi:shikimate kinase
MTKDRTTGASSVTHLHPIVVLTGFMGSGKTSTGEALAGLLGWEFVDLDQEIEAQEGFAIRDLFARNNEAQFRAIEHEALRNCLRSCARPTVIALGGGAIVQAKNAELIRMKQALTVFLETPIEEMLERCEVGAQSDPENPRPLATDVESFRALYRQRLPHYRAAHRTISTAGKSIAEVAREVADWLAYAAAP